MEFEAFIWQYWYSTKHECHFDQANTGNNRERTVVLAAFDGSMCKHNSYESPCILFEYSPKCIVRTDGRTIPLCCMNCHVSLQAARLRESLWTNSTSIFPLSCMNWHVLLKVARLSKSVRTDSTSILMSVSHYKQMVQPYKTMLYERPCVSLGSSFEQTSLNRWHKRISSPQYGVSCVALKRMPGWISLDKWYKHAASLLYGLACVA